MAGETVLTIIGNLTADPELRYTQNGLPVASFSVASTPRTFDRQANEWKDGEPLFMRCSAWRELGEHIAGSLAKGMRVVVVGNLKATSYTDRDGNQKNGIELDVQEIGPSLRYATAQVTRAASQSGGQQGGGQQQMAPQQPQNYGPPQGQPNYGPPQGAPQQAPQQPQGVPQQQGGYPAPQQAQQPAQQPQQPQQPQGFQPPQPGQWAQPGFDPNQTPF